MRPRHHSYDYRPTALALALAAAFPIASWANPLDPTVTAGQATFHQAGPALTVTNAPGTIIDWHGFSIGQGELTRFVQQSAASQVLNRVTGGDPSQILGSLQSNGQVFLINPNGIAFGPNARVDVAGLVASTLGMTNADFLAGRLNFSADLEPGSVRNEGQLRSIGGGSIYLIAPTVENHGVIQAADGAVVLAAGRTATLVDANRPDVRVEITAPGDSVLNVGRIVGGHIGIYAAAIRNEGTVSATTAMVGADGTVVFRASTSVITGNSSITEANGRLGGDVAITTDTASLGGTIRAGGAAGGHVAIDADIISQYGTVSADGATGAGGRVELRGANGVVQTVDATTSARGTDGGNITIGSGGAGLTFISGRVDASASTGYGGEIHILGGDIALAGATVAANGPLGGGTILVGGDAQGANPAIANARSVYAGFGTTIQANALANGDGGKIVLWSDDTTRVGATLTARGGATSGDGGSIEVSGKEHTTFGGSASASAPHGAAGTFLLDPKNIFIDNAVGAIDFRDLLDPHPNTDGSGGNGWGSIIELRNGNTLVTDPYDNAMGTRSGAIYVYRGTDGALLTALTGAAAQDQVGIGQRLAVSSKLLLVHSLFGSGDGAQANARGALTWLDPATGKLSDGSGSGVVSVSNSLVGTHAGDRLSFTADNQFVYPFQGTGSKYFVISQAWDSARGAITWIDTATGRLADGSTGGAVGTANSLVGVNAGDRVGSLQAVYTYNPLTGFYQTIYQPTYQKVGEGSGILFFDGYFGGAGVIANAKGAVSWMNMSTGRLSDGTTGGAVSAANSLIGATAGDHIGSTLDGSALFSTSGYDALILSPAFGGGKGAFTWISGATGKLVDGSTGGIVGTANSFTGSVAGDAVGGGTITKVSTSRYMVQSPTWGGQAGAITWIDMTTGKTVNGVSAGAIGAGNSLVGGMPGDNIAGNVTRLDSGHYLALAPDVDIPDNGEFSVADVGAITWMTNGGLLANGNAAVGQISPSTSLVGTIEHSRIGSGGYVSSGDSTTRSLLVLSPFWGGTGGSGPRGAVTWLNGITGNTLAGTSSGVLDATNSLVGALAGDRIGALDVDGLSGVQRVGSSNRNFIVASPFWNGERGAVTWISAAGKTATGANAVGTVATTNSVYGMSLGDRVGETVQRLSNGNVVIISSQWDNTGIDGDASDAGAVTWLSGNTGLLAGMTATTQFDGNFNAVSSANSLVGFDLDQRVGSGGLRTDEVSGTVLILSPDAHGTVVNDAWTGAVTWMDPSSGRLANMTAATDFPNVRGMIGVGNSLLGTGAPEFTSTSAGYLLLQRDWSGGRGALTWLGSNGRLADNTSGGLVTTANSIVGSDSAEGATMSLQRLDSTGHYVLLTPAWSDAGTKTDAGAVTWVSYSTGKLANGLGTGVISGSNSIVGSAAGDRIGSDGVLSLPYYSGAYLVRSSHWSGGGQAPGAGALTWFNGNTGLLAGMAAPNNFGEGAGIVGAGNSLVGAGADDAIGGAGTSIHEIDYWYEAPYRVFIRHGDFDGHGGAITWMRADNGQLSDGSFHGTVSTSNSLLGGTSGSAIGSGGFVSAGSNERHKFFVLSPDWNDGEGNDLAGAVTWIDGTTGRLADGSTGGLVDTPNSILGTHDGDRVGSGGLQRVTDDYYRSGHVVRSADWNGNRGAITWIDGSTGLLADGSTGGSVSEGNSIVGANANDRIGSGGIVHVSDANDAHVVLSPEWNGNTGAVTWFDGETGKLIDGTNTGGVVGVTNSLIGAANGDRIGSDGVYDLGDSRNLLRSPSWGGSIDATDVGAITWFDGRTGTLANGLAMTGAVSATNSIVGSQSGDSVGSGGFVTWLSNTGVLVMSPEWHGRRGAVTWLDRTTGLLANMTSAGDFGTVGGTVDTSNSLVGATAGDLAGGYMYQNYYYDYDAEQYVYYDVFQTTVNDPMYERALIFTRGFASNAGAVTWMNMTTGRLANDTTGGVVGAANSVVGDRAGDRVGGFEDHWTGYDNDLGTVAYIGSDAWHGSAGAVTWMNLDTGALVDGSAGGVVSASNSLVGSNAGDLVGQNRIQSNGPDGSTFLFYTSTWNSGRGAVTWMNSKGLLANMTSATNFDGAVSGTNSLVGVNATAGSVTGDRLSSNGVADESFGSSQFFLVYSGSWNGGRGAITKIDAATGQLIGGATSGNVAATNSLVGVNAGDAIGALQARSVSGGHYLVTSKTFGGGRGSVTLMDPGWTLFGQVNATNSVIGNSSNAGLQTVGSNNFLQDSGNNTSLIRFATDGTGRIVVLKNTLPLGATPDVLYDQSPGADVTVTPETIAALLNDGTRVLLQATNDIIVRKAILAAGTTNDNGSLKFEAGRSILIDANITNLNTDDGGLSFAAYANRTLASHQQAFRDAGPGVISMAAGVTVRVAGDVVLSASSIGTADRPIVLQTESSSFTTANASAGAIYLRNIGAETRTSRFDLNAPTAQIVSLDAVDNDLVIDSNPSFASNTVNLMLSAPRGVLKISDEITHSGTVTLLGNSGVTILSNVIGTGNVNVTSSGAIQVTGATVGSSSGTLTVTGTSLLVNGASAPAGLSGAQGAQLTIAGDVAITGGDGAAFLGGGGGSAGVCTGTIGGNIALTGGSGSNASATLFGSPDVGSSASPLRVGGIITFQNGTGANATARIAAAAPDSIFINFPNLMSGGYTVNGQAVTSLDGSGFYADGLPAILGDNLHITYGTVGANVLPLDYISSFDRAGRYGWPEKDLPLDPTEGLPVCQ